MTGSSYDELEYASRVGKPVAGELYEKTVRGQQAVDRVIIMLQTDGGGEATSHLQDLSLE